MPSSPRIRRLLLIAATLVMVTYGGWSAVAFADWFGEWSSRHISSRLYNAFDRRAVISANAFYVAAASAVVSGTALAPLFRLLPCVPMPMVQITAVWLCSFLLHAADEGVPYYPALALFLVQWALMISTVCLFTRTAAVATPTRSAVSVRQQMTSRWRFSTADLLLWVTLACGALATPYIIDFHALSSAVWEVSHIATTASGRNHQPNYWLLVVAASHAVIGLTVAWMMLGSGWRPVRVILAMVVTVRIGIWLPRLFDRFELFWPLGHSFTGAYEGMHRGYSTWTASHAAFLAAALLGLRSRDTIRGLILKVRRRIK